MQIKKKTLQIIGGIILLLIIVVASGLILSGNVNATTNESEINDIASHIADFDLPQGYTASFGRNTAGKLVVIYTREDGQGRIVLMQDKNLDFLNEESVRAYLEEIGQNGGRLQQKELLASSGFDIGVASTSRGFSTDGTPYVQTFVVFYGKEGGAGMSIESTLTSWNAELVRAFINSFSVEG